MHVVSSNFALVIVDSSSDRHTFVKEVMLPVLMFWGLPFETIDLGQTASHSPSATSPGVIVIIQEGIPAERLAPLAPIFEESVAAGAGIVNCDPGLEINASTTGGQFAFANRAWSNARPVRHVSVTPGDHFITRMQRAYTEFALRKPLASLPGPEGSDATVLLADDAGGPLLDSREWTGARRSLASFELGVVAGLPRLCPWDGCAALALDPLGRTQALWNRGTAAVRAFQIG